MKSKYFLYIAPILMALLFSCEKEIEFNGDKVKPKLVLNGILTPDSTVKINLTESKFFLDVENFNHYPPTEEEFERNFKRVNNATVELWKDGNKVENLTNIGKGNYIGTYIAQKGDNLRITASCEGLGSVECSTEIVVPSPIVSVDTISFREEKTYYGYFDNGVEVNDSSSYLFSIDFDIDITFKDPKDIANYYTLSMYMVLYYSDGQKWIYPFDYYSDDMVFRKRDGMNLGEDERSHLESVLFSDELLDGKEYKLKIKRPNNYSSYNISEKIKPAYPGEKVPTVVRKEMCWELQSLSPSYYLFRKTVEASSDMSEFMEYFTEPIQIYTNVKGGIGILGSYSSSIYTIPLK